MVHLREESDIESHISHQSLGPYGLTKVESIQICPMIKPCSQTFLSLSDLRTTTKNKEIIPAAKLPCKLAQKIKKGGKIQYNLFQRLSFKIIQRNKANSNHDSTCGLISKKGKITPAAKISSGYSTGNSCNLIINLGLLIGFK